MPDLRLASGDREVTMDLIHFGGCGSNSDGNAMFDDTFRPSEALLLDNEVELLNARGAKITFGVTSLTPNLRLAALKPDSAPVSRGSRVAHQAQAQ